MHSPKFDHEVQLYNFDILALDGEDLRGIAELPDQRDRAELKF